jgi:hypothetical protein
MRNDLSQAEIEQLFALVSEAVTAVGEQKENLFLAKLVFLLAAAVGDFEEVERAITHASRDI